MKASIIIAYYKDIDALELIFSALRNQSCKSFEIIIAEDDDSQETISFLQKNSDMEVTHVSQPDTGRFKPVAQNNGIIATTGDYLIFIDGDCVPHFSFVENHLGLAEQGKILVGRRANLGEKISTKLRKKELPVSILTDSYVLRYPQLAMDKGASHIEQGLYIPPSGILHSLINKRKSSLGILGCNFSCYKSDMLEINGFDESYGESAVPDDTDLQWRFEALGLEMKSCKFSANIFHLNHYRAPERYSHDISPELQLMLERKKSGQHKAHRGLDSHC